MVVSPIIIVLKNIVDENMNHILKWTGIRNASEKLQNCVWFLLAFLFLFACLDPAYIINIKRAPLTRQIGVATKPILEKMLFVLSVVLY